MDNNIFRRYRLNNDLSFNSHCISLVVLNKPSLVEPVSSEPVLYNAPVSCTTYRTSARTEHVRVRAHVTVCDAIRCDATRRDATRCDAMRRDATVRCATVRHDVLCYIISRYYMLSSVTLSYDNSMMSCYAIVGHIML